MGELKLLFRNYLRIMIFLVAAYVLCWGVTPYKTIFQSLILGTSIGILLLWSMVSKSIRLCDAVVTGKKAKSVGMLTRMGAAAIAAMIVAKYPANFSGIYLVLGLSTVYIVILVVSSLNLLNNKQK